MAATTLCPKCNQAVSVPESTSPTADVRCPHCEAEYQLADALSPAAPALIVLRDPAAAILSGDADAVSHASSLDADDTQIDFANVGETGTVDATAPAEGMREDEGGEAAADSWSSGDEVSWETDSEEESPAADTFMEGAAESAVDSTVATRSTTQKKKRRGPGPVGHFVGIVVFGMIGIVLGYFILRWIKPSAAADIDRTIAAYVPWWGGAAPNPTPANVAPPNPVGKNGPVPGGELAHDNTQQQSPIVEKQAPAVPALGDVPPEPPPAPDKIPPAVEVAFSGPVTAESATAAELRAAVMTADRAVSQKTKEVGREEYMSLCDVGHAAALVENPSGSKASELRLAAAVLVRNASTPQRRERIGFFGHAWLFDPRRPPQRSGVWLVGRVESIDPLKTSQGKLVQTLLTVRGQKEAAKVSVLSVERPSFQVGDTAGILGTIVTQPASRLAWYSGEEPLVVISGVAIGLADK